MTESDFGSLERTDTTDLCIDIVDVAGAWNDDAEAWVRGVLIPARRPGVLSAPELWRGIKDDQGELGVERSRLVVVHQIARDSVAAGDLLNDVGGLPSSIEFVHQYRARGLCAMRVPDRADPESARGLRFVAMNCVPEALDAFNDWYEGEHLPAFSSVPGVLEGMRHHDPQAPRQYLAMYRLASVDVVDSAEWPQAAKTPWTARVRPFTADRDRMNAVPHTWPTR